VSITPAATTSAAAACERDGAAQAPGAAWPQELLAGAAIDSMDDPVIVFDPHGAITLANPAARLMFGLHTPDPRVAQSLRDLALTEEDGATSLSAERHPVSEALAGRPIRHRIAAIRAAHRAMPVSVAIHAF